VQALLAESANAQPRRATSGLDSARVAMLLAVLQQRASLSLAKDDSYVATVGGVKLSEPATDLAVALAVASAKTDQPLPARSSPSARSGWQGRCGRCRDLRRITRPNASGFTHAVVPPPQRPGPVPKGFTVREVSTLPRPGLIF
jgi:DNA repair protein RadA/Sms